MYKHVTVLLKEAIEALQIKPDGIYVDCTLGGGGHASAILEKLDTGHLYAFDQDEFAVEKASKRLSKIGDNFTIIKSNFSALKSELEKRGVDHVDGVLYDLGVSSFHFDIPGRGFSYHLEAELDMRMDQSQAVSALHIINDYDSYELMRIFSKYGEITYSKRLAEAIVRYREQKRIETTMEFVDVILNAAPGAVRRKGHPAKQVFQAIRIAVNNELEVFENSLKSSLEILNKGGRTVVISFHSLEDRIAKKTFRKAVEVDLPRGLPIKEVDIIVDFKLITRKPLLPTDDEIDENIRARSAKMRVIEKIRI